MADTSQNAFRLKHDWLRLNRLVETQQHRLDEAQEALRKAHWRLDFIQERGLLSEYDDWRRQNGLFAAHEPADTEPPERDASGGGRWRG